MPTRLRGRTCEAGARTPAIYDRRDASTPVPSGEARATHSVPPPPPQSCVTIERVVAAARPRARCMVDALERVLELLLTELTPESVT
jgi:hypothetical protein